MLKAAIAYVALSGLVVAVVVGGSIVSAVDFAWDAAFGRIDHRIRRARMNP